MYRKKYKMHLKTEKNSILVYNTLTPYGKKNNCRH